MPPSRWAHLIGASADSDLLSGSINRLVMLPLVVALFVVDDKRPTEVGGLPAGYEHLHRHRFYLTPLRKIGIVIAVAAMVPILMGGNILIFLAAIAVVPIWFAARAILSIGRTKREVTGGVGRHIRVKSQRIGPSQTQSYCSERTIASLDYPSRMSRMHGSSGRIAPCGVHLELRQG